MGGVLIRTGSSANVVAEGIADIIQEETEALLRDMREHPEALPEYLRGKEPTTWDINNGRCEELAEAVAERVDGAECAPAYDPELHPFREDGGWDADHFVVLYRGRFYDCEMPEGVEHVRDLPLYRNRGKTRAEVLAERARVKSGAN